MQKKRNIRVSLRLKKEYGYWGTASIRTPQYRGKEHQSIAHHNGKD